MTTLNNASQWEFDAPKFYDFTKQENPNEQVESWFAKRSAPFSRHIRPASSKRAKETATRIPRTDANKPTKNDTTTTSSSSSSRSTTAAAPKKRVDIFDALASTPTIASAAKRTTAASDKRPHQQQQPPPPSSSSSPLTKHDITTTETSIKKPPPQSTLPSRVPRLPTRLPTQDDPTQRTHLQSKDNEFSIEDNRQQQSLSKDNDKDDKERQSLTKNNEKHDDHQLQEQQRIPADENVPPPSSSINHPRTTTKEDDRISLSLTDFNAIFHRVEDMRAQIAQVTATDIPKQAVDKATAITPPSTKTITRPTGPNMTAIEGRIQRARKAMRESLAITERWFQSTEDSSSSSSSFSYLPSHKLSQISKWRHDTTADDFSDSLSTRRRPYSDLDDTTTTRSTTTTHRSRTSRGLKRMAPTYLRTEPTIPKSPKFATDSRHARSSP